MGTALNLLKKLCKECRALEEDKVAKRICLEVEDIELEEPKIREYYRTIARLYYLRCKRRALMVHRIMVVLGLIPLLVFAIPLLGLVPSILIFMGILLTYRSLIVLDSNCFGITLLYMVSAISISIPIATSIAMNLKLVVLLCLALVLYGTISIARICASIYVIPKEFRDE